MPSATKLSCLPNGDFQTLQRSWRNTRAYASFTWTLASKFTPFG